MNNLTGNEPMKSQGENLTGNEPMLSVIPRMPAQSLAEAIAYMNQGRNKENRPYPKGRSTRVWRILNPKPGEFCGIAVRYHETDVVIYHVLGITLESGGWRTPTTKSRMNDALGAIPNCNVQIFQESGVWYVSKGVKNPLYVDRSIRVDNPDYDPEQKSQNYHFDGESSNWDWRYDSNPAYDEKNPQPYYNQVYRVPFVDGMGIDWQGDLIEYDHESAEQEHNRLQEQKRLINRYVREIRKQIKNGTLESPNSGDCWLCMMGQDSCLVSHLEETYIHGALIVRALKEYSSQALKMSIQEFWHNAHRYEHREETRYGFFTTNSLAREVVRSVRRYLKRHLGIAG